MWRDVWEYIKPRLAANGRNYVFLDEIQRVDEFEKLVDGLSARKNIDVYITGSNAHLLSGELATYLSGRYVEIAVQPLSFAEYCQAKNVKGDYPRHYSNYVRFGSFPYSLTLEDESELIPDYLDGIYNTVLVKDVLKRKRLSDAGLVERVARFLFDNIGSELSSKKIADTLTSNNRKSDPKTVEKYVSALEESFIVYNAARLLGLG